MKNYIKVFLSTLVVTTALVLTSCATNQASDSATDSAVADGEENSGEESNDEDVDAALDEILPIVDDTSMLPQFSEMQDGETIAILQTNYGDIAMRFFPEQAPMAVENFLTLAEEGYYDGVTFHRVIDEFMIQGGDPTGTGTGGESIYGDSFDDEISPYLKHFTGAVAMANSGPNTNGSQFYIVENDALDESTKAYLQNMADNPKGGQSEGESSEILITNDRYVSPLIAEEYIDIGGTPSLDYNYTIFGQVIDGIDVVHAIAEVDTYDGTDGQQDKPKEDVIIRSIEITTYGDAADSAE